MDVRDRVVELRRVSAADLVDNTGNWRAHPKAQRDAFRGLLREIGIAGALLAYPSQRQDGALVLIDGHMRKIEHGGMWPVLVLDLTDDEADKLLAFYDPIAAMAEVLSERASALAERVHTDDPALRAILDRQRAEADLAGLMAEVAEALGGPSPGGGGGIDPGGRDESRGRVRPVLWIDDLPIFERAIRAVGNPNRGEPLIAICQFYLEHHGEPEGQ